MNGEIPLVVVTVLVRQKFHQLLQFHQDRRRSMGTENEHLCGKIKTEQ